MLTWFVEVAWADPVAGGAPGASHTPLAPPDVRQVVAVGDALLAPAARSGTVPGGWVAVLGDCLDERAPGQFAVVDRAMDGETPALARARIDAMRDHAALVLVGLGARDFAPSAVDAFRADVAALVKAARGQGADVLLVGLLPGPDANAADADAALAAWSQQMGVRYVDLWSDWPRTADDRARLAAGPALTDQGHARVAAAVCDAVIAWKH